MAVRGPVVYPGNSKTETPPAGVCDIIESGQVTLSTASMSGNTSSTVIRQIGPTSGSTTLANTSAANTQLANNIGWWIPPTAGMNVTGSDLRVMPAGSTIAVRARCVSTGLAGNNVVSARAYKRSAAGALTIIAGGSFNAPNGTLGTTTNGVATITFPSEVTFAAGETIYIEIYVSIVNQTLTAGTAVLSLNQAGITWLINDTNGLTYRYVDSYATAGAGSADDTKAVSLTAKAVTGTGTAVASRAPLALLRPYLVAGTGVLSVVRQVALPRSITSIGTAILGPRLLSLAPKIATSIGSFSSVKRIILTAKVATSTGVVTATRAGMLSRSHAVTGSGVIGFARAVTVARRFLIASVGVVKTRLDIPQEALNRITVSGPTDYPITTPTKAIAGTALDDVGNPLVGATVKLFRQSDDYMCTVLTSGAGGAYSFTRDAADPNLYYVLAYSLAPDGTTQVHGVSDRNLAPA